MLKWTSFGLLVLQNSALTFALRRSSTSGARYAATSTVLLAEAIKLAGCLAWLAWTSRSAQEFISTVRHEIISARCLLLMPPGVLFTLQNNLQFVSAAHLPPAVFQVLSQSKLLFTALLGVALLNARPSAAQWASIAVLSCGLLLVQAAGGVAGSSDNDGDLLLGAASVFTGSFFAGLSAVYLERVLKDFQTSLLIRNVQLALCGTVLGLLSVVLVDGQAVASHGFFDGYTPAVWSVILLQVLGGLLISVTLRYGDALLKSYATGLSIVVTTTVSVVFLGFAVTPSYCAGSLLVLAAIALYFRIGPRCSASASAGGDSDTSIRVRRARAGTSRASAPASERSLKSR